MIWGRAEFAIMVPGCQCIISIACHISGSHGKLFLFLLRLANRATCFYGVLQSSLPRVELARGERHAFGLDGLVLDGAPVVTHTRSEV